MIKDVFDYYNFRARLQPAFLALVPLAFAGIAWAQPGAKSITAIWSLLGSAGFTFFLANLARNRGKNIEPKLWASWGGAPSTQLLRHRGPANPVLRERWHNKLSKLLSAPFPTAEEEAADPARADNIYEAATRLLIGKTRDKKAYPFIYRDNVNYGFCRNLFALKGLSIPSACIGLIGSLSAGVYAFKNSRIDYLPWGCSAVCIGLLLWWIFSVTPEWVKIPAFNYAHHLFEACEKITLPRATARGGGKK